MQCVPVVQGSGRFWEGGYTEIWTENGEAFAKVVLQVMNSEVLQHELVHAVRMGFPDSPFEEFLAYATSKVWYRRMLGPMFSSRWISLSVVVGCGLSVLLSPFFQYAMLLPFLPIAIGLPRFLRVRRCFLRAVKVVGYPKLLTMTDEEIRNAALQI